jgi:ring-1,2-phenylacetyl-CoA epoxidase subunit PaaE
MNTDFYKLTIREVRRLTMDAIAVKFTVPDALKETFRYIQGQHLTLKLDINGEDVRRSYSICGDVNQQALEVGIKRIDEGVFSNFANEQFKVGDEIEVMPPQGHFYCELDSANNKHYLCIAAGSGITPMLSHLRSILATEPNSRCTLIYGNKSSGLMMFKEQLCFIKNQYLDRFNWINLFTREQHDAEILNGRISVEKIKALADKRILDLSQLDEVFLCGPEDMILSVSDYFKSGYLTAEQVHYELFFAASAEQKKAEKAKARSQQFADKHADVTVRVSGRSTQFDLAADGTNILDAALSQGVDLPFSCKGGVCATCKAQVIEGEVDMDLNHSLTPEEVEQGMVLTCQAHPLTDKVVVDFDVI